MDAAPEPDINPRFQKIDKVVLLSQCPLFSGLSQWELKSISQLMRLIEYKKDELVYREGGQAGSFYVVVSGRFEASTSPLGKKRVLAYLRRGDYFGEMSLLTDQPHSATIRTLSDSLLLELKKDDFKKTVEHNATVSLELSRRLTSRLKGMDSHVGALFKSDILSIYSHEHQVGRTAFAINLAASLFHETGQKTVLLDMSPSGVEITSRLHLAKKIPFAQFQNIENQPPEVLTDFLSRHPSGFDVLSVAHVEKDGIGESTITSLLNHLAIDYRFVLIDLPNFIDETVLKAFSQSDAIYLVTDSHVNNITETKEVVASVERELSFPEDRIAIVIHEAVFGISTTPNTKRELFGKKRCYSLPPAPALKEYEESRSTPFVVDEPEADYSRVVRHIARHVSNNLVGVVLGSGAALGLAHIGVLKVLEREKIPIDIISGSSIGAMIAALYAVGMTAGEIEKMALEVKSKARFGLFMDLSFFPIRGLLRGKRVVRHLRSHIGNKTFDQCRIPLKITGANLTTRQIHIFESGLILDAVRASIAIPAIFNPVFIHKELVVDGGILSPLPIRAVEEAGANKIIAVNVFPALRDIQEKRIFAEEAAEKEVLMMRQKNFLARGFFKLKRAIARLFSANVFDILMNTIQSMESQIAEVEGEAADVLLRPVVPNASWVEFYRSPRFVQRGEEEAEKHLSKIKALVSQQGVL